MNLIRRILENEVSRFVLSGGSLFVLDLATFLLCRKVLGIDVAWAEFLARFTGASTGFVVHKFFTFANAKGSSAMSTKTQGVGYTATTVFNLMLSPFLVSFLVWMLDPYELMGKALGSALLACETFLVFRFVFREKSNQVSQSVASS